MTDSGRTIPDRYEDMVENMSRTGSTPLAVAERSAVGVRLLGVVELRDIVKQGIRTRFDELRRLSISTVMITGDNPLTRRPSLPRRASTTSWPKPRPRTSSL